MLHDVIRVFVDKGEVQGLKLSLECSDDSWVVAFITEEMLQKVIATAIKHKNTSA